MIINDAGRQIIEDEETLQLAVYLCPAGRWTIGYGHTGPQVTKDTRPISEHEADVILELDLSRFESVVELACPLANANQFSAMVSLAFNIGAQNFQGSTLVKKFVQGAVLSAAEEFPRWNKAKVAGVETILPGLVRRRAKERALFLQGVS